MRSSRLIVLSTLGLLACDGQRLHVGDAAGAAGRPGGTGGQAGLAAAGGQAGGTAGGAGSLVAPGSGGIVGPGGAGGGNTDLPPRLLILDPVDPTGYLHADRQYNLTLTSASDDGAVLAGVSTLYESATDLFRSYLFHWTAASGVVSLNDFVGTDAQTTNNWVSVSPDGSSLVGLIFENAPAQTGTAPFSDYPYTFYRWTNQAGYEFFAAPFPIDSGQIDFANSDGSTMFVTVQSGGREQFRWRRSEGYVSLTSLPNWPADGVYNSASSGVVSPYFSEAASVIAGQHETSAAVLTPFVWTEPDKLIELGHLSGLSTCSINVLSRDGAVAYGGCGRLPSDPVNTTQGLGSFRWTVATGMVPLTGGNAYLDTTRDGKIAMGGNGTDSLFRWTADSGEVQLQPPVDVIDTAHERIIMAQGSLGEDGASVYGALINTDPKPIPEEENLQDGSFRWSVADGFVRLEGIVSGASRDGSLQFGNTSGPVLWDCHGMRDITGELTAAGVDLQGVSLGAPFAVWPGPGIMIVGRGTGGSGTYARSWIAWLPSRC